MITLQYIIPFFLCSIGPGASAMLAQRAPVDNIKPISILPSQEQITAGKMISKVIRTPSVRYWLNKKYPIGRVLGAIFVKCMIEAKDTNYKKTFSGNIMPEMSPFQNVNSTRPCFPCYFYSGVFLAILFCPKLYFFNANQCCFDKNGT